MCCVGLLYVVYCVYFCSLFVYVCLFVYIYYLIWWIKLNIFNSVYILIWTGERSRQSARPPCLCLVSANAMQHLHRRHETATHKFSRNFTLTRMLESGAAGNDSCRWWLQRLRSSITLVYGGVEAPTVVGSDVSWKFQLWQFRKFREIFEKFHGKFSWNLWIFSSNTPD